MSNLPPILNSGYYYIRNVAYGSIRDDEGALGAIGTSKSPELVWHVTRSEDGTNKYNLTTQVDSQDASARPGGVISEIERRFYINSDPQNNIDKKPITLWRLQPILTGLDSLNPNDQTPRQPPISIAFVIYQDRDPAVCPDQGHWELNNYDKKEPVKLNRDPNDEENWPVPINYGGNALWKFDPAPNPPVTTPPSRYA
jgi:hypothetical protein